MIFKRTFGAKAIHFFSFFTLLFFFGTSTLSAQSPGGVNSNFQLWLKADTGVTNSTGVSNWIDQSPNALTGTQSNANNRPEFIPNTINFHPSIDFQGTPIGSADSNFDFINFGSVSLGLTNKVSVYYVGNVDQAGDDHYVIGQKNGFNKWRYANGYMQVIKGGTFKGDILDNFSQEVNKNYIHGYVLDDTSGYHTKNGTALASETFPVGNWSTDEETWVGGTEIGGQYSYDGQISEIIVYNETLNSIEQKRIESYLALKYGISLDQTTATDYVASDGVPFWEASINVGYTSDIFGIGRDDASGLDQRVSKSIHNGSIITIALDTDLISANNNSSRTTTHSNDKQFLVVANNGAATTSQTTEIDNDEFETRISREWKVDKTVNFAQNVNLKFNGFDRSWQLIKDNDGDFTTGATILGRLDNNGEIRNIPLNDGEYLTLAKSEEAPGGELTDLTIWLKADAGTQQSGSDVTANGATIDRWNNQVINGVTHFTESEAPDDATLLTNALNFNSVIDIDDNDRMHLAGNAIPSDYLDLDSNSAYIIYTQNKDVTSSADVIFQFENGGDGARFNLENNPVRFAAPVNSNNAVANTTFINGKYNMLSLVDTETANGDTNTIFINGKQNAQSTNSGDIDLSNGRISIGARDVNDNHSDINIAEFIIFKNEHDAPTRNRIESYLAIKYGFTLDQTTPTDYVSSEGSVVWDGTINASYKTDIFGIGRDDASSLDQKVSKSANSDAVLTIALDNDFSAANNDNGRTTSHNDDLQFLVVSNNGASLNTQVTELDVNTGFNIRLAREWKISATNFNQNVSVKFEGYDDSWTIIASTDGDFSSNVEIMGNLNVDGEFTTINPPQNGSIFTIAKFQEAPGGVDITDLELWLKADKGITGSTEITAWEDQSPTPNGYTATGLARPTLNVDFANYNPSVTFDGVNDFLTRAADQTLRTGSAYFVFTQNTVSESAGLLDDNNISLRAEQWKNTERMGITVYSGGTLGNTGDYVSTTIAPNSTLSLVNFEIDNGGPVFTISSEIDGTKTTSTVNTSGASNRYIPTAFITRNNDFQGNLAEVITFGKILTTSEKNQLETYLAIKYGISIDQTIAQDYVDSDGNITWNASENIGYDHDIFGIGRDDLSGLDQKVSQSINDVNGPLLATTQDFTSSNQTEGRTSLEEGNFMVLAHNDGTSNSFSSNFDGNANTLSARVWKVDETGTVGNVYFAIPQAAVQSATGTQLSLVISTNETFDQSDVMVSLSYDDVAGLYYAQINPSDGDYIAITDYSPQPPVFTNPTAAYNVSSAQYSGISFDVSSEVGSPYSITYNGDGTKMFVSGLYSEIVEYSLSSAFDVSTSSFVASLAGITDRTSGINFNGDGTKLYFVSADSSANVVEYSLSTPYSLASATYSQTYTAPQEPSYKDVTFNADGTKMYLLGNTANTIYEYSLSIAYDIATVAYTSNSYIITEHDRPMELDFNEEGTQLFIIADFGQILAYDLATPFDLSSIGYNSVALDVSTQEPNAYGMAFAEDGEKFYVIGFSKNVYQYEVEITLEYAENATTTIADIDANNGNGGASDEGIAYGLAAGGDNDLFSIDAATGAITFQVSPDYEGPNDANTDNKYQISVIATDSDGSTEKHITISVTDLDEPPVLSDFSPKVAGNGETVTINGSMFLGTTTVHFGDTVASSFTVVSDTQITAVVGTGSSGDITVTNAGGNDTESGFIYKVAQYDFENNVLDETDNDYDGTEINTVTYETGAQGQAICFEDGPGYVKLPDNLIENLPQFTISLRFKTTGNGTILGYQNAEALDNSLTNYIPIIMIDDDGKLKGTLWTSTGNGSIQAISANMVNDGNWHQVDLVGASNSVAIYLDGNLEANQTGAPVDHIDMSYNQLGLSYTNGYNTTTPTTWEYFDGCIDDMVIIDKALNAQDLEAVTDLPEPTITSFDPTDAGQEDTVVITGTNFDGATQVTFGGIDSASYTIDSATQITAVVGTGATGNVTVTTAGGTGMDSGFTFIPDSYTVSETTLSFDENAGTGSFTVVLDSKPLSDVVFDIASDDTGEATVSAAQLTFTPLNWNTPQTISVTGVDDNIDRDDDATVTIAVNDASSDDPFDALTDQTVAITLTDDDSAGFTVSETALTVPEYGGSDTFTVVLDTNPTSDVVFDIASDDTGEASVSPTQLTFTSANWDSPQTITVTGVDDMVDRDDDAIVTVSVNDAGSDDTFDGLDVVEVAVTFTDDDFAGFTVSETALTVTEDAGTDSFTVVLGTNPTSDVLFDITSDDTGEATIFPTQLTFTSANWDSPQTITVTGVDDMVDRDDDATVTVSVNDAGSDDTFDDLLNQTVAVTITDDDIDTDGDGILDQLDNCVNTANTNQLDSDSDGDGNVCDDDDDNDGIPDEEDAFPLDPTEDTDTDDDGTGNNTDTDDDNDGTNDTEDAYPLDETEDTDTDNDGTGDNADTNDDNDGTPDEEDAFPLNPTEDTDTDGDGTGDSADTDDDGDGTPDSEDDFPLDENEDTDTDGDGTGDNTDTDDDGDGIPDNEDDDPNTPLDTDGDGIPDSEDPDDDNDGTPDDEDDFPKDPNEDMDTDGDGTGDNADTDDDGDGTPDTEDDFPLDENEDTDTDGDGTGDNTDTDDDGDGIPDNEDNDPNTPLDTDGDGIPDSEDPDDDNDGLSDDLDPESTNPDTDGDGILDGDDADVNGDGIVDNGTDSDEDGINDANDAFDDTDTDGDGVPDSEDAFPNDANESVDQDGDGIGANEDLNDTDATVGDERRVVSAEAFTPNGDGVNDTWVIKGIENYPTAMVTVYNRYGHEVFKTQGYQNNWTGRNGSGSGTLPAGSYYYIIQFGNGIEPMNGWIFINY